MDHSFLLRSAQLNKGAVVLRLDLLYCTEVSEETFKMQKIKKYDYRVEQDGVEWKAEILRKKTSKQTVVSKSKAGFVSESAAMEWGAKQLDLFVESLRLRNKQRSKERS